MHLLYMVTPCTGPPFFPSPLRYLSTSKHRHVIGERRVFLENELIQIVFVLHPNSNRHLAVRLICPVSSHSETRLVGPVSPLGGSFGGLRAIIRRLVRSVPCPHSAVRSVGPVYPLGGSFGWSHVTIRRFFLSVPCTHSAARSVGLMSPFGGSFCRSRAPTRRFVWSVPCTHSAICLVGSVYPLGGSFGGSRVTIRRFVLSAPIYQLGDLIGRSNGQSLNSN
jgi:hypothetical protein